MDAFDADMFPDTITFQAKVRPTGVATRGAPRPDWVTPGTTLSVYVEVVVANVARPDTQQMQPKSVRRYRVFAGADTGALIDDHVTWLGRTLVVREPSVPQGPLWMFEAEDNE